jgi:glycerol kinase
MTVDSGVKLEVLKVDGGATANDTLMQLQADVLGVPVRRPKVLETTALGAAYLAGLATGFWRDADEISAQWQVDRRFEPRLGEAGRVAKLARWREAVERSKGWARS